MKAELSNPIMDISGKIFCMPTMFPNHCNICDHLDPLSIYKATADPDIMYHHQAMNEPDHHEFIKAEIKEVQDLVSRGVYVLVPKCDVPRDTKIFPSVGALCQKRDIRTGEVKKYKARLNFDGSKMVKGRDYDKTYAPVTKWHSVRLLLTLAAANNWCTRQIDYVMAYPQAPSEREQYMTIPKGFTVQKDQEDPNEYVLKMVQNGYGQKQAGRVWNEYLTEKLVKVLGFKQSKVDECVFMRGKFSMYYTQTIPSWQVHIQGKLTKSSRISRKEQDWKSASKVMCKTSWGLTSSNERMVW
jgi:hypothetical protein